MTLKTRLYHLETEDDPEVIDGGFFLIDHPDYADGTSRKVAAADMPGSGDGGTPELPDNVILDDGTTPFTAPQIGVAATSSNHLATKLQLDTIAGSASAAAASAAAAALSANDAAEAAFAAARLVVRTLADANLTTGTYTVLNTDLTKVLLCNFTVPATLQVPTGLNTVLGPASEPTVAVIDIINLTANNVTVAASAPGTLTVIGGGTAVVGAQLGACLYVHSADAHLLRRA